MGEIKKNLLDKNLLTQQVCCKKAVCQTGFYQKPVWRTVFFFIKRLYTYIYVWLNCG